MTRYIALNEFCRKKFVEGGIPSDKISVKPNFVPLPNARESSRSGALFVGRLSVEKGIQCLADACRLVPRISLRVAGTGPEEHRLVGIDGIECLGSLSGGQVLEEMSRASFLVLPSIWYENFPRTLVEAFASGLPVIASRIGALEELIEDGLTGLLFQPGDARDLRRVLCWALDNPERIREMGARARAVYFSRYCPDENYRQLKGIYEHAIQEKNLTRAVSNRPG